VGDLGYDHAAADEAAAEQNSTKRRVSMTHAQNGHKHDTI